MLFHKLSEYILYIQAKKLGKNNNRKVCFPQTSSTLSILMVAEYEQIIDYSVLEQYSIYNNTNIVKFSHTKVKTTENGVFTKQHLNGWGFPQKHLIEKIINTTYDVLINLSDGKNLAIEYLCSHSKAKFKVAGKQSNNNYDLILLQPQENAQQMLIEFVKAITNLKS